MVHHNFNTKICLLSGLSVPWCQKILVGREVPEYEK